MMKVFSSRYFAIYIVLLLFLVQSIGLTNPPLEIEHNWRQVTGLMVSRNFLEQGPDLFYPKVDDNQGGSGIIGMEFPLMNYLYYLVASVFGYSHWYGRIINAVVTCFGLLAFFHIAKSLFNEKIAQIALLMISCSIWFAFGRKMMPDTFALSLTMIGIWSGIRFLKDGKPLQIALYFIFLALGILSKIPAAVVGAFLFIPLFDKSISQQRKWTLAIVGALALAPAVWWYFVWNSHLSEKFGYWYNSGQSFSDGMRAITSHPLSFFNRFIFSGFKSYIAFTVCLTGTVLAFRQFFKSKRKYQLFALATAILSLLYIIRSGHFFIHHDYYMLPLLPFLALLGGFAVATLNKKWMVAIVLAGMFEGLANQQHELFIKESEKYKMTLEGIADIHIPKDALIVINGNGNPQQLYLAHRKGWNISNEEAQSVDFISSLKAKGADYLILNRSSKIEFAIDPVYSDDHYQIFDLRKFKNNLSRGSNV
ncbi:MAG: hypothetical protein GC193_00630 [Cryomorphaceae bacterium]|nr:hypothetical protein [Cryomorphaceae bacterium]